MQALDVDEMVAQLLASEGFSSVEELAYIDASEIASIQGFDEETAGEIQNRAAEYLAAIEREPTTTSARRSASPTNSTRSPASLPPCWWRSARTASRLSRILPAAPPTTWSAGPSARTARSSASTARFKDFPVSREEAEDMILQARLKAGWITEADLATPEDDAAPRKGRPHKRAQRRPGAAAATKSSRQCALTREVKPVADLIRFVVSPDDEVVPDTDAKAEGRGVWISLGQKAVAEAVRKKAFAQEPQDQCQGARRPGRADPAAAAAALHPGAQHGAQGRPDRHRGDQGQGGDRGRRRHRAADRHRRGGGRPARSLRGRSRASPSGRGGRFRGRRRAPFRIARFRAKWVWHSGSKM